MSAQPDPSQPCEACGGAPCLCELRAQFAARSRARQETATDRLSLREQTNSKLCEHDDQGRALCRDCAAVLGDHETVHCGGCVARAAERRARDAERQRVASIERAARAGLLGVPEWPHARVNSAEFAEKCRSERLRQFAEKYRPERGGAALLGPSGKGKTTACVALVHRLIAEGIADAIKVGESQSTALALAAGIVWTEARDVVNARTPPYDNDLIDRCKQATLLVVDEWGSEPFDRGGDLAAIVDYRDKRQGRPTIITTGLTAAEYETKYGVHTLRKVSERGVQIEES